jgi:hypothetical protein
MSGTANAGRALRECRAREPKSFAIHIPKSAIIHLEPALECLYRGNSELCAVFSHQKLRDNSIFASSLVRFLSYFSDVASHFTWHELYHGKRYKASSNYPQYSIRLEHAVLYGELLGDEGLKDSIYHDASRIFGRHNHHVSKLLS